MKDLIGIIENGNKELHAEALLVFYKDYIEIASIKDDILSEFSPLTKETLSKLLTISKSDSHISVIKGFIPSDLAYVDLNMVNKIIMFKIKSSVRDILFSDGTVSLRIPALLMVIVNNDLRVYSYTRYKGEDTLLYKAPFSNTFAEEVVCFGNIKVKTDDDINIIIDNFKRAYWGSVFGDTIKEGTKRLSDCFKNENKRYTIKQLLNEIH
jgi:hypothetical protein